MSAHRRLQNIQVPIWLRPQPERTSVSRTVREIRPTADPRYAEIGKATVFERDCLVATPNGKYWVIIETQNGEEALGV
jgi:hypothetical protein